MPRYFPIPISGVGDDPDQAIFECLFDKSGDPRKWFSGKITDREKRVLRAFQEEQTKMQRTQTPNQSLPDRKRVTVVGPKQAKFLLCAQLIFVLYSFVLVQQ
jgi:hypothetical protein